MNVPKPLDQPTFVSDMLSKATGLGVAPILGVKALLETDPNGLDAKTPGAKLDSGKLQPWLCFAGFSRALEEVAEVTTVGAKKYSRNGWAQVENGEERYMEAFGRHLLKLGKGEILDQDTGVHHKAAMCWNLLASLELEYRRQEQSLNNKPFIERNKHANPYRPQ